MMADQTCRSTAHLEAKAEGDKRMPLKRGGHGGAHLPGLARPASHGKGWIACVPFRFLVGGSGLGIPRKRGGLMAGDDRRARATCGTGQAGERLLEELTAGA